MKHSTWHLRKLMVMALLTALSFTAVCFVRIPVVLFLSYEPKDVLLTIGAFLFGPLAGAIMAIAVALLELVTISTTGIIGMTMNILSSCLFVCTAAIIYHRKRTLRGAIIGLICGAILMSAGMHCFGCALAHGETVAQAVAVHGEDLDSLLAKLNEGLED